MPQRDDNGQHPQEPGFSLPEWLATLVGRLQIENEALRQALAAATGPAPGPSSNGDTDARAVDVSRGL